MKRINMAVRFVLCTAVACFTPAVAFAHPNPGPHTGLALGFMHPLTGADHLLAIVAVGILAGSRACRITFWREVQVRALSINKTGRQLRWLSYRTCG
jgi:hydrogenase/urease accessory protein HupE